MSQFANIVALLAMSIAYVLATLTGSVLAARNFPIPPAERRIGCIDGLRGYLAVSVLFHHFVIWIRQTFYGVPWEAPPTPLFAQFGAGAVALFFMITGLVFYPRVLKGWKNTDWTAVYVTRICRIMPMVVVSVVIVSAICLTRAPVIMIGLNTVVQLLRWVLSIAEPPLFGYVRSGTINAYVLWSLKYEWIFYLLFLPACAIVADLARRRTGTWVVPLAFLALAGGVRLFFGGQAWTLYLPSFFIGMLAHEIQARPALRALFGGTIIGWLATIGFVCALLITPSPYHAAFPFFSLFFVTIACGNDIGGILRTKGALVLGECSYGIYLVHGIFLSLIFTEGIALIRIFDTDYLPLVILPPLTVIVALCTASSYRSIERPMIALGKRLSRTWTNRRSPVSALEVDVAP